MAGVPSLRLVGIEKVVSVDYLETIFACYREGRIAVPIDAGASAPKGYAFEEVITPASGGGWFTTAQAPIREDRPAQVSFSSGTTGTPKAILLSHRALADVTDRLTQVMEITPEIREYLGVPPTYSFGLARARVVAAAGGQLFVPSRGFDPTEFARMLEAGEINALSAVPTLLRALVSIPDLLPRKVARKLRWLEIGSQPMSAEEKQEIRRLFPAARIVQHYGLTEASRTTFLDIQEASTEQLASVGKPIGQTEVRIDVDGLICIRGPHVADGVLTPEGLQPIVDADGWLRTNDLGHMEDGFLFFDGRADFLLNVGGIKVPGELFEQRLIERIGGHAASIAVAARPDPMRGEVVMVAHLAETPAALILEHGRAVGADFGIGIGDLAVVQVNEIPRTDTGKVQRKLLTERHGLDAVASAIGHAPSDTATGLAEAAEDELTEREQEIAAIWRDALGMQTVRRDSSFFDLGGDSLSAITVMLKMERAGIPKEITQLIFQGRTVAEIAAFNEGGEQPLRQVHRAEVSDAITMVRGLLVLCVIAGHWGPFVLMRMGSYSDALLRWTSPFFRFGTPGFAMVFGIGLSYFGLPLLQRQPERMRANVRTNSLLLSGGVLTLAVSRLIFRIIGHEGWGPIWISETFFNVLTAYLLLMVTSPLYLRFVNRQRYPLLVTLGTAFLSLALGVGVRALWGGANTSGVLDLARLLIVAKYGYPLMFAYVMAGMALGIWIDRAHEDDDLPKVALLTGGVLMAGSLAITADLGVGSLWFKNYASVPMLVAYAGGVLVLFSAILEAIRRGYSRGAARGPFRLLGAIGVLAFLFYIGQETVLIFADGLQEAGLSRVVSLSVPLALFLLVSWLAVRRLYRLYHG